MKKNIQNYWNQYFYLDLLKEVDPFNDLHLFRSLNCAYTGNNTFWDTPSPEPDLDDLFWNEVKASDNHENIINAAKTLAASIIKWEPNSEKLIFVSILRAGVPITDWLCRMLPGANGVALSLFVGLGIDMVALERIKQDFPDRKIVFVDGWTGRGGVAKEIAKLKIGPLAVLIDPWGWADFSGLQEDIFCYTACFTGVSTLGFSRTFFINKENIFAAYKFSNKLIRKDLIYGWQQLAPDTFSVPLQKKIDKFYQETTLRIHSNEVCRALINAAPQTLFFKRDKSFVKEHFLLLQMLAEKRNVPIEYNCKNLENFHTQVACTLEKFIC